MIRNHIKLRTTACVLSILMTITAVSSVIGGNLLSYASTSAELIFDGAKNNLTSADVIGITGTTVDTKTKTNLLNGKKYEVLAYNTAGDPINKNTANLAGIADGTVNNVDVYAAGSACELVFDLSGTVTPQYFVMINRPETTLQTFEYELYGSDTYSGARNSSSLITSYKRTDSGSDDRQINIFKFNNSTNIKYLRVRLIKANGSFDSSFRFCEMALLGDFVSAETGKVLTESDTIDLPTLNPLSALSKSFAVNGNDCSGKVNGSGSIDDGSLNGEFSVSSNFADYNTDNTVTWKTDGSQYVDITYAFANPVDISNIIVVNHSNIYLRTGHYKLYASNSLDELYNNDNLLAEYKNTAKAQRQLFNFEAESGAKTVKYTGLRIIDPVTDHGNADVTKVTASQNNIYIRLLEFRVYGLESAPVEKDNELIYNGNIAESIKKDLYTISNNSIVTEKENILKDKYVDITSVSGSGDLNSISQDNINSLTDGSVSDIKATDLSSNSYIDMTYFLGGTAAPKYFVFVNRSELTLQTYKYALYASDTYAGLENSESLLCTYERTGAADTDLQCNIFKFKKLSNVKYFRIRLLNANSGLDKTFRICELQLYGDYSADAEESITSDNSTEIPDYENQLIYKNQIFTQKRKGEDESTANVYSTGTLHDSSDGTDFSASTLFAKYVNKTVEWYTDGTVHFDITYDFGSTANINHIAVLNHNNVYLRTGHYVLYASDTKSDLFDSGNIISDYNNSDKMKRQLFNLSNIKARYVGMRVLDPVSDHGTKTVTTVTENAADNNIYPRLCEFSVYGTYIDPEYINEPDVKAIYETATGEPLMTDAEFAKLGKSLISGQMGTAKLKNIRNKFVEEKLKPVTDGIVEPKTNGSTTIYAHADLNQPTVTDGSEPLDLIYKLGDGETLYDITRFAYIGIGAPGASYITGWYQVYAAEDYDDLFKSSSMLFEYNYNSDALARGHIVTYKKDHYKRACYFAVRILNPVAAGATEWIYARVSEIAVYGSKSVIIPNPTNLAKNMPISAYLADSAGKLTNVLENNLTVREIANLTDGNSSTYANITTGGKNLELIYNLCGDMKIDSIYVKSVADKAKYLKEFKVYASATMEDLWSEKAMVYHYNAKNSNPEKALNSKTFASPVTMRYVRISVLNSGQASACDIEEIGIIGMDNQQFKLKSVTGGILPENVVTYSENLKTGAISYETIPEDKISALFDNDKVTSDTIYGAKVGESSLNIMIYLGDLKNLTSMQLYFLGKAINYLPVGMEVYIGETEESVMSEKATPYHTFTAMPQNGNYSLDIAPKLARYIRFCFKDGNPGLNEIFETINVAFTEIVINGTSVKGTQRSDDHDELLTYSDKATGISWEIIRTDKNDIFTAVASSKLVASKATNAQKASLYTNPYYKINDNKIYDIKFYDLTGKEVTDLSGRSLRINVPVSGDDVLGKVLIGSAESMDAIVMRDTFPGESTEPYYVYSVFEPGESFKFAITNLTTKSDKYWDEVDFSNTSIIPDSDSDSKLDSNSNNKTDNGEYFDDETNDQINTGENRAELFWIIAILSMAMLAIMYTILLNKEKSR